MEMVCLHALIKGERTTKLCLSLAKGKQISSYTSRATY